MKLFSTAQARIFDANATRDFGIASGELMARAGRAATRFILAEWPLAQRIDVICGPGNNGGDGYVVAQLLKLAVRSVRVFAFGVPDQKQSPDAYAAMSLYRDQGGEITALATSIDLLQSADLVVDALLGIGGRPLSGELENCVNRLNSFCKNVVALDVPSGLDSDSGFAQVAVRASTTVSFIVPKLGLFTSVAKRYVGRLVVESLDLPAALFVEIEAVAHALTQSGFAMTERDPVSHKGRFGHVFAIGGAPGMGGAIRLCAQAALRVGAGLVSVASTAEHRNALLIACPELMSHTAEYLPMPTSGRVVVLGPGLGRDEFAQQWFAQVMQWPNARVLDADALNLLAANGAQTLGENTVLTPHPGEAARLLDCEISVVETNRPEAVRRLAQRYGCVAVLKGAGTLIAAPSVRELGVCSFGNAGMASGGMGDVLAGVIAGLLAQGLSTFDAAEQGVLLHAQAADIVAREGMRGMLASDVILALRRVVNAL